VATNGSCQCTGRPRCQLLSQRQPSLFAPTSRNTTLANQAATSPAFWPAGSQLRAPGPGAAHQATQKTKRRLTFQQKLVLVLWFIILFDPQFLLQALGLGFAVRIPLVLTIVLAISLFMRMGKGEWFWGILTWLGLMVIDIPFAYNRGEAIPPLRTLILFYLIALAVVRSFNNARDVGPLFFLLCVGQYLWWGLMGVKTGAVWWHPNLGNFDGYGPIMACGVGPAYYYAMSTNSRWRRFLGLSASALSVLGVVSAFARGGVLALVVTIAYIWMRSPKKGRATALVLAGFLLVVIAASVIDGTTRGDDTRSNFWEEMGTMFDDSEGSTGDDRKQLWEAAIKVWEAHPVLGVGAANFGPAAVTIISHGDLKGSIYDDNPLTLYGRALHSNYFQLLSEFGIAGVCLYVYMIYEFFRRSRHICRRARYIDLTPAQLHDPRSLALGLESGLVAYLVTGVFFNQLYQSWFFGLIIANALLYKMARRTEVPVASSLNGLARA